MDILISLSNLNCVLVLTQSSLILKATSIAHTQVRERPVRVPSPVRESIIALKHPIDNTEAPKIPNQTQHIPLLVAATSRVKHIQELTRLQSHPTIHGPS